MVATVCMSLRHFRFGTKKISSHMIYVAQGVPVSAEMFSYKPLMLGEKVDTVNIMRISII